MGGESGGGQVGGEGSERGSPRCRSKLGNRRRAFALEYLLDGNATQAAIRAGYSAKTAASQGHDLLKDPKVQAIVASRVAKAEERTEVKLDRVLQELHRILLVDPIHALNEYGGVKALSEWPEDLRRAMSGMDIEETWDGRGPAAVQTGVVKRVRFWSKTEAAQQLLRVLGAFRDKVEHSGVVVQVIDPYAAKPTRAGK